MQYLKRTPGFTIVELLIVIVVIAILATITLVTYSGVQKMAAKTVVQSDLENAATTIKVAMISQGLQTVTSFPAEVKPSAKVGLSLSNPTNGGAFCANGTYEGYSDVIYHYDSEEGLQTGACSGAVIANSTIGTGTTPPADNPEEPQPSGPVVSDNFNRSNSTTSLGSAQTGQSWILQNTFAPNMPQGQWGISDNRAYSVAGAENDTTVINAGITNAEASIRFYGLGANRYPGMLFRGDTSTGTFYLVEIQGTNGSVLLAQSGGDLTTSASNVYHEGDLLTVKARTVSDGVEIEVLVNGTRILYGTDDDSPNKPSGTLFGLRYGVSGTQTNTLRYDDFSVSAL